MGMHMQGQWTAAPAGSGAPLACLELLELLTHAPALVVGQRVSVLLEQRVDARDAAVPAVLQVLQRQPPVLRQEAGTGGFSQARQGTLAHGARAALQVP